MSLISLGDMLFLWCILSYSIQSDLATFPYAERSALLDDITDTQIVISPLMASNGFILTLSFDSWVIKNDFLPQIDIASQTDYIVNISDDGKSFVPVKEWELSNYSFHYIRFLFPKWAETQSNIYLRTIRFDKKMKDIYIVEPIHYGEIEAYKGWICDQNKLSAIISQRNSLGKKLDITTEVKTPILTQFKPLLTTWYDSDGDMIIDMRDNCASVSNKDQKDRNYDGIGDACSDDDNDRIFGFSDNCPTVSNSDQKDLNANNIWDACEFDTDSDGISDGADNCIHSPNPDQKDSDAVSIGDVCDNCKLYNPDQTDLNKNSNWDICEDAIVYEEKNDKDKDGKLDFSDNCPTIPNPDQNDSDIDTIGDACDNCISIKNPDQKDENKNGKGEMCEDADTDGIDGWRDNCPTISNLDQKDSNNDGVWDICSDSDNDGIYDGQDNCPAAYNLDQKDIDNDQVGNACDQKDDRILESNKTIFIVIFTLISLVFIGGIIYFLRKLKI